MLRGVGRLVMLLGWALVGSVPAGAADAVAPGSWQGRAPALTVARSDRRSCSQPMVPPALAAGRRLASLGWQFSVSGGAPLRAWLCHPQQCIALPAGRGRSSALAGLDAGQPLQLCFLPHAAAGARQVGDLQLLVDYR